MARRVPERQVPGVHHRRVGADVVVTAVSDGHLDGSMAVIQNIEPEEAARMLRDAFRPVPRRTAVNTFLVHSGGKVRRGGPWRLGPGLSRARRSA